MKKINIITPVYNEEEGIEHFNQILQQTLTQLSDKYTFEVIFVLDKSRDRTIEKIKKICTEYPNARLLALSRRFGHQMSLVAGMDFCDSEAVIMMDCDLEHPPAVIPELLEKFEQGFDVVSTQREYNEKVGFFKKITSHWFYQILNHLSKVEVREATADFRLLSRKALRVFQTQIREQNQFLRGLVPWIGFEQAIVKFKSASRQQGVSKYNLRRLVSFAVAGIVAFSKVPLRWSIFLGFILSAFSFIYTIISLTMYFISPNTKAPGFPTLIIFITLIGGMQLIVLGIIGEYIGNIFEEVKRRPLYIIEEKVGWQEQDL
ncbi:MAG: glycosyltransferase family 2 protein [Microscillaceae bacterium]|jgi:dolichol-phosphate mannosyltransferase|nr:glycosyltransferase family 2 protein [Microscillaceae bacterium]